MGLWGHVKNPDVKMTAKVRNGVRTIISEENEEGNPCIIVPTDVIVHEAQDK